MRQRRPAGSSADLTTKDQLDNTDDVRASVNQQPLPAEATARIELARAHHETRIRRHLVDWCSEAPVSAGSSPTLTRKHQSELQELLIDEWVAFGDAEGRERLAVSLSPTQFESEIDHLTEIIAHQAQVRWKSLTRRYHLEREAAEAPASPEVEIGQCVRHRFTAVSERLLLEAWSHHAKRLKAGPMSLQTKALLGERLDVLRRDRGWTVDELATKANVDKKTVLRIIHKGKQGTPNTHKKLADALGLTVRELTN